MPDPTIFSVVHGGYAMGSCRRRSGTYADAVARRNPPSTRSGVSLVVFQVGCPVSGPQRCRRSYAPRSVGARSCCRPFELSISAGAQPVLGHLKPGRVKSGNGLSEVQPIPWSPRLSPTHMEFAVSYHEAELPAGFYGPAIRAEPSSTLFCVAGSTTSIAAPGPVRAPGSADAMRMEPSCASTMERHIASPIPTPS